MKIDHIGYAVRDIEKAKEAMKELGFVFEDIIEDKDRNIRICFGEHDGYRVELVSPMGAGSPIDSYLSKTGPVPYHFCYKSSDMEADLEKLRKKHFRITIPPAPAVAFDNKRVVFLSSLSIGLIEIVEE